MRRYCCFGKRAKHLYVFIAQKKFSSLLSSTLTLMNVPRELTFCAEWYFERQHNTSLNITYKNALLNERMRSSFSTVRIERVSPPFFPFLPVITISLLLLNKHQVILTIISFSIPGLTFPEFPLKDSKKKKVCQFSLFKVSFNHFLQGLVWKLSFIS